VVGGWLGANQRPGRFLGIFGRDSRVSKSHRLHVDVFRFLFIGFEVYSLNSSKMISVLPEVLNFNRLFLGFIWFICN
jgi:hypothetical protein